MLTLDPLGVPFPRAVHVRSCTSSLRRAVKHKLTVSPLLIPVASRNLMLYQSLPTHMPYREAKVRRRKDDTRNAPRRSTICVKTSGDTRQSLHISSRRCAHGGALSTGA